MTTPPEVAAEPVYRDPSFWQREPALIVGFVLALIALAVSFGVHVSDETKGAITGVIVAACALAGSLLVRRTVDSPATRAARSRNSAQLANRAKIAEKSADDLALRLEENATAAQQRESEHAAELAAAQDDQGHQQILATLAWAAQQEQTQPVVLRYGLHPMDTDPVLPADGGELDAGRVSVQDSPQPASFGDFVDVTPVGWAGGYEGNREQATAPVEGVEVEGYSVGDEQAATEHDDGAAFTMDSAEPEPEPLKAVGVHDHPTRKLGARPPSHKPALLLADHLIGGALPAAPIADPAPDLVWPMDENDIAGDCVVAGLDHALQAICTALEGSYVNWTKAQILSLYRTQNPGFNSWADAGSDADGGMDIQTFLAYLVKQGVILGFAKVDPTNEAEVKAAIYLGLAIVTGEDLRKAQQDQSTWDYVAGSPDWGGHCLAPGTRVLTDDLRWVPIEDVLPGEGLVGFDEHSGPGKPRKYRRAVVEASEVIELPCYELAFEDGTTVVCSADHMWLQESGWTRTDAMRVGLGARSSQVRKPLEVWETDESRDGGYLAAAFDGEGWIDDEKSRHIHRIGFAQRSNAMWDRVTSALKARGYAAHERPVKPTSGFGSGDVNHLTVAPRSEVLRFLGSIRPHRLLAKFNAERLGRMHSGHVRLVSKVDVGVRSVVAVKTTTGTFIAEGLASHNCTAWVGFPGTPDTDTCVTWGELVPMTQAFVKRQVSEAWFIITKAHVDHPEFRKGFDLGTFAAAYTAITGRAFPVPVAPPAPTPAPSPAPGGDASFQAAVASYSGLAAILTRRAAGRHMTVDEYAAWLLAKDAGVR